MRTLSSIFAALVMVSSGAAWAQGADKKPAEAKPAEAKPAADKAPSKGEAKAAEAKGAPGGEMAMKPAPELQEAFKGMVGGVWKCTGTGTMMGKEMKSTGTYRANWDLDKYWVVGKMEEKAGGMPGVHKMTDMYGYDPASKQFVNFSVDNMGGYMTSKSSGWQGDKMEWTGKGNMMGKEMDMKWSITKKSDKEVAISGSMGSDHFESTCKK